MADLPPYRNAEQAALDVIADLFPDGNVSTKTPPNLEVDCPFARVKRVGGADLAPYTDRARLVADVFALTYSEAFNLAEAVRQRFLSAPDPFDYIETVTSPVQAEWASGSPVRWFTATYSASLRRSSAA